MSNPRQIGHTFGLTANSSKEHQRAEQVYVNHTNPVADPDGTHPIEINGWVGYGSAGLIRVTRRQATDLIGVLAKALAETEVEA